MKRNYYFPWHRLQSAPQTKDQSWWNNISETENELLRLSSLMLVTLRFPKQHHSWPFGSHIYCSKSARVVFRKHWHLAATSLSFPAGHVFEIMFEDDLDWEKKLGRKPAVSPAENPPFYADWEKNGPMSLVPVVDGSEIPQQPPGMYSTLANNGISTTNLNWLAEFLKHQQYQLGLWNNRSTSQHIIELLGCLHLA